MGSYKVSCSLGLNSLSPLLATHRSLPLKNNGAAFQPPLGSVGLEYNLPGTCIGLSIEQWEETS